MRDDAVLRRALPLGRGLGPWSARKQRLHLQCVAAISRHSGLSEDRIRQYNQYNIKNINVPVSIIKNEESEARSYAKLRIYSVKQMSL